MITPGEYIRRVDAKVNADIKWAWSKKWIRLPVSVFSVLFSLYAFVMTVLLGIQSYELFTFNFWLLFIFVLIIWIGLFYCGVKGLLK